MCELLHLLLLYASYNWYRHSDVCLVTALGVNMLPWLDMLLCTNHTRTYTVTTGTRQELEKWLALYCCCAAAVY